MLKKLFGFDKGVHTLLWARLQMFLGILWAVLSMTPMEPLLAAVGLGKWTSVILFGMGMIGEAVRRYKAEDV